MHQYYYVNSNASGQLFHHRISVPPLYSQPQIFKLREINGPGIPNGWSGRVYPAAWKSPEGLMGFDRMEQPVNGTSAAGHMGLTAQEPSSGWITPIDVTVYTPHEHNGNSMLPVVHDDWELQEQQANWLQLPEHPGLASQGPPTPWSQPNNHAGMSAHEQPQGLAPAASHTDFNTQKQLFPWAQPINHAGMLAQGNPAAMLPPSANPFGFSAIGPQANWDGFGNPAGWGGPINPMGWGGPGAQMGWGNNGGKGQPGILGSLLKMGKGTMNGIGIISSLIGVGKFLF